MGLLKAGCIVPNSVLLLGPDVGNGKFNPVGIKSIHYKRLPVNKVRLRQSPHQAAPRPQLRPAAHRTCTFPERSAHNGAQGH